MADSLKSMTVQVSNNAQHKDLCTQYKKFLPKVEQDLLLEVVLAIRVDRLETSENRLWMSQLVFGTNHVNSQV